MILLLPALICVLGAAVIPRFSTRRSRNIFVFCVTLLSSLALAFVTLRSSGETFVLLQVLPTLSMSFRVDAVNRIFLLLIAFLWPLAALYAFEYMEHETREGRFFVFYTLAYAVTQLLALSANIFTLYIFYECLTLTTFPLVTHKENADSTGAGFTYLKYTVGGAALAMEALVVLYGIAGGIADFTPGGVVTAETVVSSGHLHHFQIAFLFAFVGFGAKAAIFPLSSWLPRASVAPTPVTALLHAVAVVNAGVFACIRLIYDTFGTALIAGTWAQTAAVLLAAFTILFGAVAAVRERHLKRRLAWSTVYHLSYMLLAAALMTPAGLYAALAHMLAHGITKISLFFCAGAFLIRAGAEYVPDLRGISRSMPRITAFYVLAAFSLTGIPPLIGFLSKWDVASAAVAQGAWPAWIGAGAVIISSVLACVYLLEPAVQMIFLRAPEPRAASDPSWRMLLPLLILAVCIVLPAFWSAPVSSLLSAAVAPY